MSDDARFGATSTAADVVAGYDLTGQTVIVTGGSSGIGVETARALAGAGAEVVLAARNPEAGAQLAAEIAATVRRRGGVRAVQDRERPVRRGGEPPVGPRAGSRPTR